MTKAETNLKVIACYATKAANAKRAGKEFNMSLSTFANIKEQTHCAYSGLEFNKENVFSLERIDNSIGYVDGNVIPVTKYINTLRGDHETPESIQEHIDTLRKTLEGQLVALNMNKARLGAANVIIAEGPTDATKAVEKIVIPAKFYHQWKTYHRLMDRIDSIDLGIRSYNSALVKWEKSNSPNAKTKIKNLKNMIAAANRGKPEVHHALSCVTGVLQKLPRRECVVKIDCPRMAKHTELRDAALIQIGNIKTNMATNEKIVEALTHAKAGLTRFQNLSKLDKNRLKYGLPLSAPLTLVLKHKMAYNLINQL